MLSLNKFNILDRQSLEDCLSKNYKNKKIYMFLLIIEDIKYDNLNENYNNLNLIYQELQNNLKSFDILLYKLKLDYFIFTENYNNLFLLYEYLKKYKIRIITCFETYENLSKHLLYLNIVNEYNINTINKKIIEYDLFNELKNKVIEENNIYEKIKKGKTIVYKQAIFDKNKKIIKYECLSRLKYKDKIYLPSEFLNVARRYNLYNLITCNMISDSFFYFQNQKKGFSINLENSDLESTDVLDTLERRFLDYPKLDVTIEFTEIDSLSDKSICLLKDLRERFKCKISIDDFGVNNSNLYNVVKLQPDYIKIDGEFIKNIENEDYQKIVKNIVSLAKSFNAKTIAEYVSNKNFNLLKKLDIDYFQGFDLHMPEFLKNNCQDRE